MNGITGPNPCQFCSGHTAGLDDEVIWLQAALRERVSADIELLHIIELQQLEGRGIMTLQYGLRSLIADQLQDPILDKKQGK